MLNEFSRTKLLIGEKNLLKLSDAHVAIFGIGGVGGYCVEALARCGIGNIDIIDNDKICITNINRQIYATHKTIDKYKVDVAKERILDINPNIKVNTFKIFYMSETSNLIDFNKYDYIIDAIDTVSAKLSLIEQAKKYNIPIICSMGTGNKIYPEKLEIADIAKTSVCPLARVIRTELKKRKIKNVKVVYSKEIPIKPEKSEETSVKRQTPGSISFVPPVAGLIMAGEVVKDLIKGNNNARN